MKKLRTFTRKDYFIFQGATKLPDGRTQMIAEGETATLLLCGFDSSKDFGIDIVFNEGKSSILEACKCYTDIAMAEVDAGLLAQLLDFDLSEDFLLDLGFDIIY